MRRCYRLSYSGAVRRQLGITILTGLLAGTLGGCRERERKGADKPAPSAATPAPSPTALTPTALPPTESVTTSSTAAPAVRTHLVSHLIGGQVIIEVVEDSADPADAPPPPAKDSSSTTASATTDAGSAGDAGPLDESARLLAAATKEAEPSRRVDILKRALAVKGLSVASAAAVHGALGKAYDEQNDSLAAIDAWERVNELTPNVPGVFALLEDLRRKAAAEKGFSRIARQHFEARFEGDARKDLAETALVQLDDAWRAIGDKVALYPPASITVIFYSGDKYQTALNVPDWSGGIFDGKIRIRESSLHIERGGLRDLLYHEYSHALLNTAVRGEVPAWMHEGLAQRMEPGIDRERLRARLTALGRDQLPSLQGLRAPFATKSARNAHVAYACALDLVDMLADWRGERSFAALFEEMNKGKQFDDAIDAVYGLSPELMESRWRARW